jgi:hypothetical protein
MKHDSTLKHKAAWQCVKGVLTFNWCLIARESMEPLKTGKLETTVTVGAPVDDVKRGIPSTGKPRKTCQKAADAYRKGCDGKQME